MKIEEYTQQLRLLEKDFESKRFKLARLFAMHNNPVNIGDIVTDGRTRIKVDHIKIRTFGVPDCVYYGPKLTKKNKPFKHGDDGEVYQSNSPKVIKRHDE